MRPTHRADRGNRESSRRTIPLRKPSYERCCKLGGLKAGEKMFDLGSGDGRIVIMAARKFHAEPSGWNR